MNKLLISILFIISLNASQEYTNELIKEESPYLLQHAHNPVNWFSWNKESLQKAKKENKLIFVSIGYSTCHWCHVMEEESFKNKEIAKLLNKDYISIKIDKEQSPHLDTTFQNIHSKLKKRRNGWPLNFILTPNQELVYITTYIPDIFNYGVEGMITLIPRIAKEYKNNKLSKQINNYKKKLTQKESLVKKETTKLSLQYIELMRKRYDKIYKGFDKQPKFPLASHLNLLLDIYSLTKNKEAYTLATKSLEAMAYGGINDQIEGGFFRYSVYPDWVIPHFEKMLYTQAELIAVYIKAYKLTNKDIFRQTVIKTIEATNKIFRNKEALYYSASDADSLLLNKKEEGVYYTYTFEEAKKVLTKNSISNYEEILEYLGFDDFGNFENSLNNTYILDNTEKKPKNLKSALSLFKKLRKKRAFPFVDKKVITSWNSLMIKSLFLASSIDKKYLKEAKESLESLLTNLTNKQEIYHQKFDLKKANKIGLFEDYAFLEDLLITAYQSSFDSSYLKKALEINEIILTKFYKNKLWYLDSKKLYKVDFSDKYYTAAISRHLHNRLTLSNLTSNLKELEKSKELIKEQTNKILVNIDKHPEAIRTLIRVKKGDIIIKSSKQNLLNKKEQINQIKYPFLLQSIQDTNLFLGCNEKSCFTYNKSLNIVIQAIDK